MTGGVSEVMYQITEIPFWNLETTTDVSKLDNVNLKPEPNGVHRVSVLKAFTHLLYDANFPNKAADLNAMKQLDLQSLCWALYQRKKVGFGQ